MNLSRNKKLFTLGVIIALIVALPLTIIVTRQQQNTRSKAAASTSLSFTPASSPTAPLTESPNSTIPLTIAITPGANQVSLVSLEITYDPTKLEPTGPTPFVAKTSVFPQTIEGPVYSPGKIRVSLSVGSDPRSAVTTPSEVGTITFKALSNTSQPTSVSFGSQTQVYSVAGADQGSENVLATSNPAYISIGFGQSEEPTVSPTITHTVKIQGNYVDQNNAPFARAGQVVEAINFNTGHRFTTTATPSWSLDVPRGKYTITADNLNAYDVSNSVCHDCTFHSSYSGGISASVDFLLNTSQQYVDVSFKYTPILPTYTPAPTVVIPSPSPTIEPSVAGILMYLNLHGIGRAGDSVSPQNSAGSNKNPKDTSRLVELWVYNKDEASVRFFKQVMATYDPAGYYFISTRLGDIQDGDYIIKVKVPGFLQKRLPGIFTADTGIYKGTPAIDLIAGDVNDDNSLNILDYSILMDCGYGDLDPLPLTNPQSSYNKSACQAHNVRFVDLNNDGILNTKDFNLFLREFSIRTGD